MTQPKASRDPAITSRIMATIRSKDTKPELTLRRELHRRGLRYRVHDRTLRGKPDITFRGAHVAVFVDGDFWHGGNWRQRGRSSLEDELTQTNKDYWLSKIKRNLERDEAVNEELRSQGWNVIRVLISELQGNVASVADTVEQAVRGS